MKVGELIDRLSHYPRDWHVLGFLSFPLNHSNYLLNLIHTDGHPSASSSGSGNVLLSMKGGELDMNELSPKNRMDTTNGKSR